MIYFDNAATSGKKPLAVVNAVKNALLDYSVNPGRSGYKASVNAAEIIYLTREKTANFFGCENAENVSFHLNCTQAINFVLKGVLKTGDRVLISNIEHNAVARPVNSLEKFFGVKVDIFNAFSENLEQEIGSLIRPDTKMIFCMHASNVCGKVIPIKSIGEICKKRGIYFGVDAAQTAGVLPINMNDYNIDFLCVAAHKGLFAPMGTGILLARKPINNTIIEGGTGTNSINLLQPEDMPERFESGTLNVPGIFGISAGIDFVKMKNTDNIYKHEMSLCNCFVNILINNKKIVFYKYNPVSNVPVISFNITGIHSDRLGEILADKGYALRSGLHCAPMAHKALGTIETGTVRFSPGIFNNYFEVEKIANEISKIAKTA